MLDLKWFVDKQLSEEICALEKGSTNHHAQTTAGEKTGRESAPEVQLSVPLGV